MVSAIYGDSTMKNLTKKSFLFLLLAVFVSSAAVAQQEKKICLTMIVKNEGKVIERCLTSAKDIVDCISICDTGSTDDTVAIIEQFMQKHHIPGKVYRHEWKNFGHNRTLSVTSAQKTLEELSFSLPDTYLLLLDADMILQVGKNFKKSDLRQDGYLLIQKSASTAYHNTRLIRASMPWECIGVTHEYWSTKQPHHMLPLKTLEIDDREDGGCKADKFERDVKLLTQGLKDEPNNVRYMFYCAQSHKCLRQFEDAIKWYKNRIAKGGWKEEIWYSKYMIGECFEDMGYWDQALHWYLDAYQYAPNRAEPLYKIARYYRLNGQQELSYVFTKMGLAIPYPGDQLLFVSYPVYDYQFDEELSIIAFYTRFKEEGYAAANRLILKKNVPDYVKERARQNLLFYLQGFNSVSFRPIKIDLPLIREGYPERYRPMNPSIQRTEDGYDVICRTNNWSQEGGQNYRSRDPLDGTIRTRNFLLKYDRNFKLLSQHEIIEELPREKKPVTVIGLEDCRLVNWNNAHWFTCTTYDVPKKNVSESLCKLADQPANGTYAVEKFIPLQGPDPNRCEKNWLPFVKDNALHVIYLYEPFIVYKLNPENGACDLVIKHDTSHDFARFRGAAGPIEWNDGYLVLTHEVIQTDHRHYVHRFLYLDKDFEVKKISRPFNFRNQDIEYCGGMTIDHSGTKCIMTVGIDDKEAYLCTVDLKTIAAMLELLP